MTLLVTSAVDRKLHAALAGKLMAYNSVHAEQVGFVEKPENPNAAARLQMAGGEFCGNASLALCAYLVWSGQVECEAQCTVPVEVSGASGILLCDIKREGACFLGKISMPVPRAIKTFYAEIGGLRRALPLVLMPGISHVIVDIDEMEASKEAIAQALMENSSVFTTDTEDAFGIMFYSKAASSINKPSARITPFVCVKASGTKVWERGCGSGSAALGAYLAHNSGGNVKMDIVQPGGVIMVEVCVAEGNITGISIEGKIEIAAYGKAFAAI